MAPHTATRTVTGPGSVSSQCPMLAFLDTIPTPRDPVMSAGELAAARRRVSPRAPKRIDRAGAERQMAENAVVIRRLEQQVDELLAELSADFVMPNFDGVACAESVPNDVVEIASMSTSARKENVVALGEPPLSLGTAASPEEGQAVELNGNGIA